MDKDISTQLQEIKTKTGWNEFRLASEIGTSQPTVNRILNGQKECKGSTFRAIDRLHQKIMFPPKSPRSITARQVLSASKVTS